MDQADKPTKKWRWLQWGSVLGVTGLVGLISMASWQMVKMAGEQAASIKNVRSIGGLFLAWAADNGGIFPDAIHYDERKTANLVFRQLFKDELLDDEKLFGAVRSPYKPDGEVGLAPYYAQAVGPNENHWMMFGEQSNASPSNQVVLFENSADASWPPWWHRGVEGPMRGRVWPGGKIAICFTDCSVMMVTLVDKDGKLMLPESVLIPDPNPKFPRPLPSVLDIETR